VSGSKTLNCGTNVHPDRLSRKIPDTGIIKDAVIVTEYLLFMSADIQHFVTFSS